MKFKKVLIVLTLISFCALNADTQTYYGKIDYKYPITMKLTFNNNKSINGYYFYNKWKKKINLLGKYNQNSFSLSAKNEIFTGVFSNDEISGEWNNKSSSMRFFGHSQKNVNPFKDKKLTCEEMKNYPKLIFNEPIDLGSGYGSPIDVEYHCDNSIAELKFMQKLFTISKDVNSKHISGICSGSIVHAGWRYYHFTLLKIGLAPDLISSSNVSLMKPNEDSVKKYFSYWGYSNLGNFKLYSSFMEEYNKVHPLLVEHYKKTFSVSQKKAIYYSDIACRAVLLDTAGYSGMNFTKDETIFNDTEVMLMKPTTTLEAVKKEIEGLAPRYLTSALKVALLHNKSESFIRLLLNNGAEINNGEESALFFEESNLKNIQLLLDNDADINYPNRLGKTVLYYAIERNNLDLVKLLINNGANINHKYIDAKTKEDYAELCSLEHTKRTPLMHAAQNSNVEMLKYLISKGANKDAIDEINYNILDYAHMEKEDKNIAYLESIGLTTKRTHW